MESKSTKETFTQTESASSSDDDEETVISKLQTVEEWYRKRKEYYENKLKSFRNVGNRDSENNIIQTDTEMEEYLHYNRTKGAADTCGIEFENNMMAFLCIRCKTRGYMFYIGNNVASGEKFDDIVLHYIDNDVHHTILMQLKHKSKGDLDLLASGKRNQKCNITEYFKSYCKIKEEWCLGGKIPQWWGNFENFKFVLFTNSNIDLKGHELQISNEGNEFIYTKGKILKLQSNDDIKNIIKLTDVTESSEDCVIDEFLQNFYIFADQGSVEYIKNLMKKDIAEYCNWSDIGAKKKVNEILKYMEDQRKIKSTTAMTENIISYDSGENILKTLNDNYKSGIDTSCICFNDKSIKEFTQIKSCNRVFVTKTAAGALCCLKIKQALEMMQDHPITINSQLLDDETVQNITNIWPSKFTQNLIIHDGSRDKIEFDRFVKIMKQLQNHARDQYGIFLIIDERKILNDEKFKDTLNILQNKMKYKELKVEIGFQQLTSDSQNHVSDKTINFQGCLVKIKAIFPTEFLNTLNGPCLTLLLEEGEHPLGDHIIPQEYHIKRKITFHNHIRRDIINNNFNSIIAVSGNFSKDDFKNLNVQNIHSFIDNVPLLIPVSNNTAHNLPVPNTNFRININFNIASNGRPEGTNTKIRNIPRDQMDQSVILNDNMKKITSEEDFEKLCQRYPSVHWLELNNNILKWKRSQGDMTPLHRHQMNDSGETIEIGSVYDIPGKIVLIVAQPGMGKSTLIKQIAYNTKQKYPTTWVIKINLQDSTNILNNIKKKNIKNDDIIDFLFSSYPNNKAKSLWKQMYRNYLKVCKNTVVLIDGFDEILPKYEKNAILILQELKQMNINKICLTSRPICNVSLEQKLKILSCSINPFTENDKKTFFMQYWRNSNICESQKQLDIIGEKILKINAHSQYLNIPLHCEMMAEAYIEIIQKYLKNSNSELAMKINELQLYEKFIEKKINIYCEKYKIDSSNLEIEAIMEEKKESVEQGCMHVSFLEILSSSECKNIQPPIDPKPFLNKIKSGKEKTGLISCVRDGKPQFVHRMFSEYFAAKYLFQNCSKNYELITEIMLAHSKRFMGVKRIMDLLLFQNLPLHMAVMNYDLKKLEPLLTKSNALKLDKLGRTPLHVAVQNIPLLITHPVHIFQYETGLLILENLLTLEETNLDKRDFFSNQTALGYFTYGISVSSWTPIAMLLDKYESSNENLDNFIDFIEKLPDKNAFYDGIFFASQNGNIKLLLKLLRNYKIKVRRDKNLKSVLQDAIKLASVNGKNDISQELTKILRCES